ncbi:MAG: hypothetical protein L3J54_09720 [Draconibacterium sp.]|nr:hypothetical protein [Draconibacterium sp.]
MKNRKRNRKLGFDYSTEAIYFLTVCCKNRIHHFGEINDNKMNYINQNPENWTEDIFNKKIDYTGR